MSEVRFSHVWNDRISNTPQEKRVALKQTQVKVVVTDFQWTRKKEGLVSKHCNFGPCTMEQYEAYRNRDRSFYDPEVNMGEPTIYVSLTLENPVEFCYNDRIYGFPKYVELECYEEFKEVIGEKSDEFDEDECIYEDNLDVLRESFIGKEYNAYIVPGYMEGDYSCAWLQTELLCLDCNKNVMAPLGGFIAAMQKPE